MKVFSKRKWVEHCFRMGLSKEHIMEHLDNWVIICDGLPKEACQKLGFSIMDIDCIDEESKTTETEKSKEARMVFNKEKCIKLMREKFTTMLPLFIVEKLIEDAESWMDDLDGLDIETCREKGYSVHEEWCDTI